MRSSSTLAGAAYFSLVNVSPRCSRMAARAVAGTAVLWIFGDNVEDRRATPLHSLIMVCAHGRSREPLDPTLGRWRPGARSRRDGRVLGLPPLALLCCSRVGFCSNAGRGVLVMVPGCSSNGPSAADLESNEIRAACLMGHVMDSSRACPGSGHEAAERTKLNGGYSDLRSQILSADLGKDFFGFGDTARDQNPLLEGYRVPLGRASAPQPLCSSAGCQRAARRITPPSRIPGLGDRSDRIGIGRCRRRDLRARFLPCRRHCHRAARARWSVPRCRNAAHRCARGRETRRSTSGVLSRSSTLPHRLKNYSGKTVAYFCAAESGGDHDAAGGRSP